MRPVDAVTIREAADILGCSITQVRRHILTGRLTSGGRYEHRTLSRANVEELALEIYRWRRHRREDSYWVTGRQAAVILGVNVSRLNQLVAAERIPYETHADGTRLYRREQLEVVANARDARWSRWH